MKDIIGRKGYAENSSLMEPEKFLPWMVRQADGGITMSVSLDNSERLEWLYAEDADGNIIDIKRLKEHDNSTAEKDNDNEDRGRSLELTSVRLDAAVSKSTYLTPFAVWHSERVFQGEPVKNETVLESELLEKFAWARKELQMADGKPPIVTGDPSLDAALHKVTRKDYDDEDSDDGLDDL